MVQWLNTLLNRVINKKSLMKLLKVGLIRRVRKSLKVINSEGNENEIISVFMIELEP